LHVNKEEEEEEKYAKPYNDPFITRHRCKVRALCTDAVVWISVGRVPVQWLSRHGEASSIKKRTIKSEEKG